MVYDRHCTGSCAHSQLSLSVTQMHKLLDAEFTASYNSICGGGSMFTDMKDTMADGQYRMMRANPRYPFFADAEVTLRDGTSVLAQLEQLSARGCYIDALEPIPLRSKLRLRITDGFSTCELHGQVIYMHSGGGLGIWGMGVRFDDMGTEQNSTIDSWLRGLAKNPKANTILPSA